MDGSVSKQVIVFVLVIYMYIFILEGFLPFYLIGEPWWPTRE